MKDYAAEINNYAEEVTRNFENRFASTSYKKAIEWLACFMAPGADDFDMFGDCVELVAKKYNLSINTVSFDAAVYAAELYR